MTKVKYKKKAELRDANISVSVISILILFALILSNDWIEVNLIIQTIIIRLGIVYNIFALGYFLIGRRYMREKPVKIAEQKQVEMIMIANVVLLNLMFAFFVDDYDIIEYLMYSVMLISVFTIFFLLFKTKIFK